VQALLNVNYSEVGYRLGYVPVLRDISFKVFPGEALLLLGNNGTGKSTLLRGIAGDPQVYMNGKLQFKNDVLKCRPKDLLNKGIIWVPQHGGTFAALSVLKNLQMAAKKFASDGYKPALELFPDIACFIDKKTEMLSGGQRRMVELAVLPLMKHPSVLLLDEPTSSLSSENAARFHHYLNSIMENGTALIIATHIELDIHNIAQTIRL